MAQQSLSRPRHDPLKNLVAFVIGDVNYAFSIDCVREIVNPLSIIELPSSPSAVAGVADYRGDVVPVIDLRVRFGLSASTLTRRTKWILVDVGLAQEAQGPSSPSGASGSRLVAVIVDAVTDVFGTGGAELRPAPPLGAGDDVRGIAGVTTFANLMVFVLDPTRFIGLTDSLEMGVPPSLGGGARYFAGTEKRLTVPPAEET